MKKSITYIVILFSFSVSLAQWTQLQPELLLKPMPVLLDSVHAGVNFYDFAGNIAGLFEDEHHFSLWAGSGIDYTDGGYRLPFEPTIRNDQQYTVRLVKPLTERNIFKGYFGYHHNIDQSLLWIHQNRLSQVNPFVLADSSRGTFVLDGLFWSGEWAHKFNRHWQSGIGVYYNVDHRLKQVFPKPEDRHRDVHFRAGIQNSYRKWRWGIAFRYFDEQEKVIITKYNLQQNLTPVLYKFRYADLPVVLLGKTSEERLINYHGALVAGHFLAKIRNHLRALGNLRYITSSGKVEDGGSSPLPQGTFDWQVWNARAQFSLRKSQKTEWVLRYDFRYESSKSQHPDFSITTGKRTNVTHAIMLGVKQKVKGKSFLFADATYQRSREQEKDLMTENFYDLGYHWASVRLGISTRASKWWSSSAWINLQRYITFRERISGNQYSEFFQALFLNRFSYLSNRSFGIGAGFQVTYHYGPMFDAVLTGQFLSQSGGKEWNGSKYLHNQFLNICLKFYII